MRIGLMIGSDKERPRADRLSGLLADGRAAEADGFASFWIPQVPGYLDAMTAVALLGHLTERIEIGTAVVPLQTRQPDHSGAAGADHAGRVCGRFTLGVGPLTTGSSATSSGCPTTNGAAGPRLSRCARGGVSTGRARSRSTTSPSPCTAPSMSPTHTRCRCSSRR